MMEHKTQVQFKQQINLVKYFCLLALVVLFSCNEKPSRQEEIKNYLTGGSEKCWMFVRGYPAIKHEGIMYKSDGTYISFIETFETKKRVIYTWHNNPTWKLKNDSVISDGIGVDYIIEYINDDIMVLNDTKFSKVLVYIKAKDQQKKPVVDTAALNTPGVIPL